MLLLEGMATTCNGVTSPWIAPDDTNIESLRRRHMVSIVGHCAWLAVELAVVTLIVWMAYWILRAWRRRWHVPGSEVRALAIGTAGVAAFSLACMAYMTWLAYGWAGDWTPPTILEQPAGPIVHATVTLVPWLMMSGITSIVVGSLVLQRMVHADRQRGLAELAAGVAQHRD